MRHYGTKIPGCSACLLLVTVGLTGTRSPAAETTSPTEMVGTAVQHAQWIEGLSHLGRGQTERASTLIHELVTEGVADPRVQRVDNWLSEYRATQAERRARIRADYEKYVSWALEDAENDRWAEAVWSCGRAFETAEDTDVFRKEEWLLETTRGAAEAALELEEEEKWYKAASIYVRLNEIFPDNEEYRDSLDRTQERIRIELMYDPESEWETAVRDVSPEMARDAFRKIATDYLKEPDFKAAAIGGLEQLLRLTDHPKLGETFEAMEDEIAVDEFRIRIRKLLMNTKEEDELSVNKLIGLFEKAVGINDEVRLFPSEVLTHEFVHGALQPLDKFSDMIWPADVPDFIKHTQGKFSGVGIQIRKNTGEPILVVSPLKDSPAYAAGIRPGDLITKINGKAARKYSISRAVREITGPPGTTVTLTIRRPVSDEEFDVQLERQEIVIHTIKGNERDDSGEWEFMIDPENRIGYLRMTNFTEGTFDELRDVLTDLHDEQNMRGLIFDLRDNPGGPLRAAVDVSDLFLDPDKLIVSTKDRYGKPWEVSSSTEAVFTDFPMIVLVSRYSASASEIVAGALQVHNRAIILGERSYGKGSVQQVLPLNRTRLAFLKLTTALYYLPDGRCLHKDEESETWGVDPDVPCEVVPKERVKLNELQLKRDILKGKNQAELTDEEIRQVTEYRSATRPSETDDNADGGKDGSGDAPEPDDVAKDDEDGEEDDEDDVEITRTDPNNYPEYDPQLDEAVLLMRVWLQTDQLFADVPARVAAKDADGTDG